MKINNNLLQKKTLIAENAKRNKNQNNLSTVSVCSVQSFCSFFFCFKAKNINGNFLSLTPEKKKSKCQEIAANSGK